MDVDDVPAELLSADEVARLLAPLTQREREVLALRFGLDRSDRPRTPEEVASAFAISDYEVDEIVNSALSKLAATPHVRRSRRAPISSMDGASEVLSDMETDEGEYSRADFQVEFDGYMYSWHRNEWAKTQDATEPEISAELEAELDEILEDEREHQRWRRKIANSRRRKTQNRADRKKRQLRVSEALESGDHSDECQEVLSNAPQETLIGDTAVAAQTFVTDASIGSMMGKLDAIEKAFVLFEKGALSESEYKDLKVKILGE